MHGQTGAGRGRGSTISRRGLIKGAAAVGSAAAIGAGGAACSGRGGAGEPLQFWNFYAPQSQQLPQLVAQGDWFTSAVNDWNAAHPEQIELVFVTDYVNPMNPRIATAFAADRGPDIFLLSPGEFLRYYNGGVLVDLKPYMSAEAVADFYPEAIDTRVVNDGIYALPMEIEPLSIYYDADAFEKARLSEADLPKTWDELLEVASKLTTPERSGLVLETQPGYYQNFTFYPWVWMGGGDIVDPKTQQVRMSADPVINALKLFGTTISRGVAPRTLPASGEIVGGFGSGLAAMWQRGPWSIAELAEQAPDQRYGIFPLPTPAGGKPTTSDGGWAWAVNKRGRNPEAAARFVVESVGSMEQASIDRGADWNYRAKSNLPARKSVDVASRSLPSYKDPQRAAVRAQLTGSRGEPRYPPVMYKALSNAIQSVQLAGGDPREQAEIAANAIESFLKTYDGGSLI